MSLVLIVQSFRSPIRRHQQADNLCEFGHALQPPQAPGSLGTCARVAGVVAFDENGVDRRFWLTYLNRRAGAAAFRGGA